MGSFALELSSDWADYVAHFGIDVLATIATLYARSFCRHGWHQFLVWLGLSVVVTVTTVNLVG
jgi:hypothetical protein